MSSNKQIAVWFEPRNGMFMGFIPMEAIESMGVDPDPVLRKAGEVYQRSIMDMRSLVAEIAAFRQHHKPTPARKVWQLGNAVFQLKAQLERSSLQLEGFYDQLTRDLGVKRKWLEKVIIFRRYLPEEKLIPESLNWGRCEKGTRKVAEGLRAGRPMDKAVSAAL